MAYGIEIRIQDLSYWHVGADFIGSILYWVL